MKLQYTFGVLFIILNSFFEYHCAKILAILTTPTRSHHIWNTPLMQSLASRGHHVTVVSPTPHKEPYPNLTDIVLEGALEFTDGESDYQSMVEFTPIEWIAGTFDWYAAACSYSLSTKGAKTLFEMPKTTKFDLIIIEASGGECFLGFIHRFGSPPVIAVNGFGSPLWVNQNMGNYQNPALISNPVLTYIHPMSFMQRVKNCIMYIAVTYYYYNNYLPSQNKVVKQHFGENVPPVEKILSNVSLALVSAHYSIDGPHSMVPSVIPVAGIHVKQPMPLPKDIQKFIDEAKDGVIYFSLGSLIHSNKMTADKRQAFLDAFAELPQRVLWKWESDSLPGQPSNVKVGKWLPQNDILAHPNVRVFISHSGLLSTHEATYHGVPVVGMPFIVDQYINIQKVINHGVGVRLDYLTLTKESVLTALKTVLNDPSYHQKMKYLSTLFREQSEKPLDRAVFWVEHVLKHGGAPHLHSPSLDLAWYQLLLFDVLALLLAGILISILVLWLIGRTLYRVIIGSLKKEKVKHN